jgi:hypothetical protein
VSSRWRSRRRGLCAAAGLAALALGCGDGGGTKRPWFLTVQAQWNDSPSAVDQIGYQLWVDVLWPDRNKDCYPLPPDVQIVVGDQVLTPTIQGDCSSEMLVLANGFQQGGSVTVAVQDRDQVLATGVFDNLFPNVAVTVIDPSAGQPVKAGDPITVALPNPPSMLAGARFYWTETPAGVPPYYTFSPAMIATDGTIQTTAPATGGRALMNIQTIFPGGGNFVSAASCSGFQYCDAVPNWEDAGPVAIDVVP